MPIQFRCAACDRLLGIARRKAGTLVNCPRCGASVMVPVMAGMAIESPGPGGSLASYSSVVVPRTSGDEDRKGRGEAKRSSESASAPVPATSSPLENLPLFERSDFETLLNPALAKVRTSETESDIARQEFPVPRTPKPVPSSPPEVFQFTDVEPDQALNDVDVLSGLVITKRKLIIAAVVIAILLGLAFAAGYLLAVKTVAAPRPTATTSVEPT